MTVNSGGIEQKTIEELRARIKKLEAGIKAVAELIDESNGVYGLHMNGDVSPWPELLQGGMFEEWLLDFSVATAQQHATKEEDNDTI